MSSISTVTTPPQPAETRRDRVAAAQFGRQMADISRQSSIFFAGTLFTALTGYLFRVYLARELGAELLGIYALGMTIVNFLGVFNCLGLPQAAVRFVASYSATGKWEQLGGFIGRSVAILLLCNLPILALMLLAGPWFSVHFYHAPLLVPYLWLFALIMLLGEFTLFFGQVLAGYKDVSRRTMITNFVGSPVTMGIAVAFLVLGTGLWGYIFAQVAGAVIVLLLMGAAVWKLTPHQARTALSARSNLEREVVSFSAASLGIGFLELLMSQTDKILIGFYLSARYVGIYAMAMALVGFVPIALQSVNQIFTPTIADLHARGDREMLGRLFQTLTKWIVGLTFPLAIVIVIFSRPVMGIFGHDFESGWPILVIGTLGQLINCAAGSAGYLLLMSGNQRRLVKIQAVSAGVTVLLGLLLIPHWGMVGGALVAALTGAACNMLCLREVNKALGLQPYNRGYLRLLPPVLAVVAVALFTRAVLLPSHSAAVTVACTFMLGYVIFIGIALAVGLSADDQLLVEVVTANLSTPRRTKRKYRGSLLTSVPPEEISTL